MLISERKKKSRENNSETTIDQNFDKRPKDNLF